MWHFHLLVVFCVFICNFQLHLRPILPHLPSLLYLNCNILQDKYFIHECILTRRRDGMFCDLGVLVLHYKRHVHTTCIAAHVQTLQIDLTCRYLTDMAAVVHLELKPRTVTLVQSSVDRYLSRDFRHLTVRMTSRFETNISAMIKSNSCSRA